MCTDLMKKIIKRLHLSKEPLLEVVLQFFENRYQSSILEAINIILQEEQSYYSRAICNSIILLQELLRNYGIKRLNSLQPFLKLICLKYAQGAQPQVRKCAKEFLVEAYRWMGESMKQYLVQLRSIQQKELLIAF